MEMTAARLWTRRCSAVVALALAAEILSVSLAGADTRVIPLAELERVKISRAFYGAQPAGDVNGDDIPDFLLTDPGRSAVPEAKVFVVFGSAEMADVDVKSGDMDGFVIDGIREHPAAAGAGDVNGDGLDDIIVGIGPSARAYVVFGKASTMPVNVMAFDVNAQATQGFRIDGNRSFGAAVSTAGDMNQDGLSEVIVGAPFEGESYVIFGKTDFLPVDTQDIRNSDEGTPGFLIRTPEPEYGDEYWVDGGGDINGDGIPDVIVTVFHMQRQSRGLWVIFGKANTDDLDVANLGDAGFFVEGWVANGQHVGDMNGDGFDDLALYASRVQIVYGSGKPRDLSIKDLPLDQGFKIRYEILPSGYTDDFNTAGDINSDGLPDLVLGESRLDPEDKASGSTYVVLARRRSSHVRLKDLGRRGFRIDGLPGNRFFGSSVAGIGDLDGDGRSEILSGERASGEGRAFIIWGHNFR